MNDRSDESYGQHGSSWVDRFGVWLSLRALSGCFSTQEKLRVLDVGCGYHAALMMAMGRKIEEGWGLDFHLNPDLQQRGNYKFLEGPIEETMRQVPTDYFDRILIVSVLEHLSDPLAVLRMAHASLKPGGIMITNVPTWRGKFFLEISAFRLGLSPKTEMDDHKMYYNKRDFWPLLVKAGFKPSRLKLKYHKFGLNLFAVAAK